MKKLFRLPTMIFVVVCTGAQSGTSQNPEKPLKISLSMRKDGLAYIKQLASFVPDCEDYFSGKCGNVLGDGEKLDQLIGAVEDQIKKDSPAKPPVGDQWYVRLLTLVKNAEKAYLKAARDASYWAERDQVHNSTKPSPWTPDTHSPQTFDASEKAKSAEKPWHSCFKTAWDATKKGALLVSDVEKCQDQCCHQ